VEDEDGLRNLIRRTLVAAGYTVLTAANGPEALGLSELHQADIQLVLTDIVMPQMGGRVLAERLAAARPGIKVLYMSGYTDDAIVHHGVVGAGTHFLGKPFSAVALTRKVRDVLDG
jgi:CheY-like chemotaxis protein